MQFQKLKVKEKFCEQVEKLKVEEKFCAQVEKLKVESEMNSQSKSPNAGLWSRYIHTFRFDQSCFKRVGLQCNKCMTVDVSLNLNITIFSNN